MFDKLTPAHLRLAAYVVAVVAGIAMVVTGAIEADNLHGWVGETSTTLGAALAALGGLAGMNIDRADSRPVEIAVDAEAVVDAITPAVVDAIRDTAVDPREKAEDLLDAMRARVDAARGGEPRAASINAARAAREPASPAVTARGSRR